jgi:hypothetical protein
MFIATGPQANVFAPVGAKSCSEAFCTKSLSPGVRANRTTENSRATATPVAARVGKSVIAGISKNRR